MAGGTIYLEPILADLQEKVGQLENKMSEAAEKIDSQLIELRSIANSIGAAANPNNVYVNHVEKKNIIDYSLSETEIELPLQYNASTSKPAYTFNFISGVNGSIGIKCDCSAGLMLSAPYSGDPYSASLTMSFSITDKTTNQAVTPTYISGNTSMSYSGFSGVGSKIYKDNTLEAYFDITAKHTYEIKIMLTWGYSGANNGYNALFIGKPENSEIYFAYTNVLIPENAILVTPANS